MGDLRYRELVAALAEMGEPDWRARQIWGFAFKQRRTSFDGMHTLPKTLRRDLADRFRIEALPVLDESVSADGTRKLLFGLHDERAVESVLIPEERRLTLCISSQVGCNYGCRFCLTGVRGFARNLALSEIVGQVLGAQDRLAEGERISNVVYMGMGEPLANLEAVLGSLEILTEPLGLDLSGRRITVSTVGLVPAMRRLVEESPVELAVSLHATTDEVRSRIVPVNRRYDLATLLGACRELPLRRRSRITFEYTMLDGVNDLPGDAARLARILRGIPSKINLIPFNTFGGAPFAPSPPERVEAFADDLRRANYTVMIRRTRGFDASAACGMLGRIAPPEDFTSGSSSPAGRTT